MVDIHCHILPGVDDGSKSWEMSLEMCRLAHEDGVQHIVATPHANYEYSYNRGQLNATLQELQTRFGDGLSFSLGCDFHLSFENLEAAFANPHNFTISGTDYMLVELSDYGIPPRILDSLKYLGEKGITPILTHPERNPIMQNDLRRVQEWTEAGSVVQVTASSVTGFWGDAAKKSAMRLLENRCVHVLASDAHDTKRRTPVLSAARAVLTKHFGEEFSTALVEANPKAIVTNQPLPFSFARKATP